MNASKHAEISVAKRGGVKDDYYPIHSFMDSTKELCSDHRHRILHNLWGIRRVIIPIFGSTITNSLGKVINVKDLCEQDHVLPDYSNKFIPTISDFIAQIENLTIVEKEKINEIHSQFNFNKQERELLLSPLSISGELKSLLITHNSWFLNEIIPKISNRKTEISEYPISSSLLFNKMKYADWMDNGRIGIPPSSKKVEAIL